MQVCVMQVCAMQVCVMQVCERYLANGENVFWAFMDLENGYDTIDRHGIWQILRVYGIVGNFMKAFSVDSRARVWMGMDVSECFPVNVGLRQCYVMSPWLFNAYKNGVVSRGNDRVLMEGLELLIANDGRFEIIQLLFADNTALVADSEKLCRLVSKFGRVSERRKLRVNVGKSKVMRCTRYRNGM